MNDVIIVVALLVIFIAGGLFAIRRAKRATVAAGSDRAARATQPDISTTGDVEVIGSAVPADLPPAFPEFDATAAPASFASVEPLTHRTSEPSIADTHSGFEPADILDHGAVSTPALASDGTVETGWFRQFDPRSTGLDDTARLRLIGDLGVIADDWCVPLLCDAYREEQRPANRQAALVALAACHSQDAVATYRLALASEHRDERAIAADALADLEPARATRTIVERR